MVKERVLKYGVALKRSAFGRKNKKDFYQFSLCRAGNFIDLTGICDEETLSENFQDRGSIDNVFPVILQYSFNKMNKAISQKGTLINSRVSVFSLYVGNIIHS